VPPGPVLWNSGAAGDGQHTGGDRIGFLNCYNYLISNGPMGEINNKIGALQRIAYE